MLVCLSIDHRQVDLSALERIEQHSPEIISVIDNPDVARGSVVLATCNRFEVYLDVEQSKQQPKSSAIDQAIGAVFDRVQQVTGIASPQLTSAIGVFEGGDAAEHLFAVSGGLESAVIGEGEIAGQVRRALERARAHGRVTPALERLFQLATRTSREIKNRTELQTAGRSLVRVALSMAESRIGDWAHTRVLLIGTGAYAGASLAALRARGAQQVSVYSPSGRAEKFAASHDIKAVPEPLLDRTLTDTDLVVACSSVRDPLLSSERFARTVTSGRDPFCHLQPVHSSFPRPRLLVDMGLPRNIDPEAASVPGVELLDLELVIKHAPLPELSAEAEARKIVSDAAAEFIAGRAETAAVPTLVALRDHVGEILQDELSRISRDGEPDPAVEAALRHFAGRILHQPTVRLREVARAGGAEEAARAVELLFGIGSEDPADALRELHRSPARQAPFGPDNTPTGSETAEGSAPGCPVIPAG